jgi:UDP-2,3-diacylglucosamine pyrophosphatase LpxH
MEISALKGLVMGHLHKKTLTTVPLTNIPETITSVALV